MRAVVVGARGPQQDRRGSWCCGDSPGRLRNNQNVVGADQRPSRPRVPLMGTSRTMHGIVARRVIKNGVKRFFAEVVNPLERCRRGQQARV